MKTAWFKDGKFQGFRMDKQPDGKNYFPVLDDMPVLAEDETANFSGVSLENGIVHVQYTKHQNKKPIDTRSMVLALIKGDAQKVQEFKDALETTQELAKAK